MTMALILAVSRRLSEGERLVRAGKWTGWSPTSMLGHRIWGKRLGIIGMGRIGQAVARRARGFGLSIHYHNRRRVHDSIEHELEATYWESLDQMLARMDSFCQLPSYAGDLSPAFRRRLVTAARCHHRQPTAAGDEQNALARLLAAGDLAGAASTSSSTSQRSIPSCSSCRTWCCCPTWGPRPSRAAWRWAKRC